MTKTEKEEEISEKIDEAKLALEYMEKDKEKSKPNKNDFNKIVYVEYQDLFKNKIQEIDFLYDYSKILGSQNSDPKIIQWQLANLDRLFKYGIDISLLKKRNDQQNLGIYKMSNIIENISYRLQKHGKLAPTIDVARILPKRDEEQYQINEEEEDEEDINIENEDMNSKNDINTNTGLNNEAPLINNNNNSDNNNNLNKIKILNDTDNSNDNNKSNNDKNEIKNEENNNENKISIDLNKKPSNNPNANNVYEDNFYDKNDPFIDDDLDNNSSEENAELYKLSLGYGNFSEQDILNNLKRSNRSNSLKKKKKMKNIKGKKGKKSPGKKERKRIGNKILLSNKTKRKNEGDKDNTINKKKKKININIDSIENLTKEKIEEIFNQLKSENDTEITTDHEKESFLRRNIKIFEEMYKKNLTDFISFLSSKFNIDLDKTKVFMEYELFKSVLENKYSNLSKFLNKLYTLLKENGVMEINTMEQIEKYNETIPDIGKSLNHISDNIVNYRDKFNSYMGKHYSDMYLINESLENFIPHIKERNIEYITKISSKFNEYEEKFKIKINKDIFITYIKNKYPNNDFSEDLDTDINNRKFSLESFIIYEIGSKIPVFFQVEKKKDDKDKEKEKEGNFVVDIKKEDTDIIKNNQENINNFDNNENLNSISNSISNNSKIFQSLKMNENKLKIFSSKIKINNEESEGANSNLNK